MCSDRLHNRGIEHNEDLDTVYFACQQTNKWFSSPWLINDREKITSEH